MFSSFFFFLFATTRTTNVFWLTQRAELSLPDPRRDPQEKYQIWQDLTINPESGQRCDSSHALTLVFAQCNSADFSGVTPDSHQCNREQRRAPPTSACRETVCTYGIFSYLQTPRRYTNPDICSKLPST